MIIVGYFNTGRLYTQNGQEIHATYDTETLELRFDDYSRMISGRWESVSADTTRWEQFPDIFARFVMRHYDVGGYDWAYTRARPVQELRKTRI